MADWRWCVLHPVRSPRAQYCDLKLEARTTTQVTGLIVSERFNQVAVRDWKFGGCFARAFPTCRAQVGESNVLRFRRGILSSNPLSKSATPLLCFTLSGNGGSTQPIVVGTRLRARRLHMMVNARPRRV